MTIELKVPAMGESITEATVANIIKPSGSPVAVDDELLELETDKVNQIIYAPQAGLVTYNVAKDQVVKIGEVIGTIDTEAAAAPATAPAPPAAPKPEKPAAPAPEPKPEKPAAPAQEAKAKPAAPKEAEPPARLLQEDFIADVRKPAAAPIAPPKPQPKTAEKAISMTGKPESRRKMTKIRKVIAQRLVEVQLTTAMLTTFNEVDMSEVIAIREKHKETFMKEHGVKLGFMSFFVKACVSAIQAFPDINSYLDGDDIVTREYCDIGIAVGTERGLVVPVVRDCEKQTFAGIEKAIEQYAVKARKGGLLVDDLQGGGFTITNGGVYGSLLSTPILNPPQSAILGMHKIQKRPVVVDDQIAIRPMMYLALSYDHRVVDGKEAVSFLIHVKEFLEDPARLLLEG